MNFRLSGFSIRWGSLRSLLRSASGRKFSASMRINSPIYVCMTLLLSVLGMGMDCGPESPCESNCTSQTTPKTCGGNAVNTSTQTYTTFALDAHGCGFGDRENANSTTEAASCTYKLYSKPSRLCTYVVSDGSGSGLIWQLLSDSPQDAISCVYLDYCYGCQLSVQSESGCVTIQ
jgi:hypothetical protein